MKKFNLILIGLVAATGPISALGDSLPAISFTGGSEVQSGQPQTTGFAFSVNNPIEVNSLGFFDAGLDGLVNNHEVGIFEGSTLLSSATVPSGTSAPLINQFRYVPITTLTLSPGNDYTIGAFFSASDADLAVIQATGFSVNPSINYMGSRLTDPSSSTFAAPTESVPDADPGIFGPIFLIGAPVPDMGSSFTLFGLSLAGIVGSRYRKK